MYKFIQKNQKKMLAIFAVGLMIVFVLPSTCGQNMGERQDPVVAYLGDEKLLASEMAVAREDWATLKRVPTFSAMYFQQVPYVLKLGEPVVREIEKNPDLFLLLQKEAGRAGIEVPQERVSMVLSSEVGIPPGASADEVNRLRRAVGHFLLAQSVVDRVASNVKVSEPELRHALAEISQQIKLNLVEFGADEFKAAAPAPTPEQLQEQFEKFAGVPASQPTTNPSELAFGYQYPDRVKIQYLEVPRQQVKEAVKKGKEPYAWEVQARRYYLANPKEFAATQPATPPEAAIPRLTPPPAATTRPFAEVQEEILDRIMEPEIDRLTADIRARILERMRADWEAHRKKSVPAGTSSTPAALTPAAAPDPQPPAVPPAVAAASEATPGTPDPGAPAASAKTAAPVDPATPTVSANPAAPAVPTPLATPAAPASPATPTTPTTPPTPATPEGGFESFAYLEQLAADIQKEFGVLPAVTSKAEWLTEKDLTALPGIGAASRTDLGFPPYVSQWTEPFVAPANKADSRVLSLLEPSEALRDAGDNLYVFRITEAQPAHAPADLAEVREKVEADVLAATGYQAARAAANKLLEAAEKQRLADAAKAASRPVITTGRFDQSALRASFLDQGQEIKNYPLDNEAKAHFIAEAYKLLGTATESERHPVALIELPSAKKIVAAELAEVTSRFQGDTAYQMQLYSARRLAFERAQLAGEWFSYNAVTSRLGYRPSDPAQPKPPDEPEADLPTNESASAVP